ncbi:MAG: hypothetical protein KDC01_06045 [Flavobacteriales bacterium]|nr:hypothetical protein [Flavobacteriales bacterium]
MNHPTRTIMDIEGIIAIIATFSTAFGIVYIVMSTRHRERMAMIQRGINPNEGGRTPDPERSLKNGMQLIGVAVGLGCGYLLDVYTNIDQPWVYFGPVMFFVGLVMILYYFRSRKPV